MTSFHPGTIDPEAIKRANTIWDFDNELVIKRLGFPSVEAYYAASSPLQLLAEISKPSLIIYAADNPLFHPDLVTDLQAACSSNPNIDLLILVAVVIWAISIANRSKSKLKTLIFGGLGIEFCSGGI